MNWTIHTRLRTEPRSFALDETGLVAADNSGHPELLPRQDLLLGTAGELVFYLNGNAPSFDMEVCRNERSVRLLHVQLSKRLFVWIPSLDAVGILSGDLGTSVTRRVRILGLAQLREALDAGVEELDSDDLDATSIIGSQCGVDFDHDGLTLSAVRGAPELFVSWNVPRADPPEANLVVVRFPYAEGVRLAMARPEASPLFKVDRFWLNALSAAVLPDGSRRLSMLGVVRRSTNFHLGLRRLDTNVSHFAAALREFTPTEQIFTEVHLRNSGALEKALALPDQNGYLFTIETPARKRVLHRLAMGAKHELRTINLEPVPVLLSLVEQSAQPMSSASPSPVPSTGAELMAPPPSAIVVASSPVPPAAFGPGTLSSPAAGGAKPFSSGAIRESSVVLVEPPGCSVSLGHYAADATVWPKVYVIGDAAWADLRWWVSQSSRDGALVAYTLHVQSSRSLMLRVVV